jgi:hypothetical protein
VEEQAICARAPPPPHPPLCLGGVLVRPDDGAIDVVDAPVEPPGRVGLPQDAVDDPAMVMRGANGT